MDTPLDPFLQPVLVHIYCIHHVCIAALGYVLFSSVTAVDINTKAHFMKSQSHVY